ncbi:L,D-transpeptidase family protein [bacterium]|nr:L,D-transpeptidase family protein [bacterium]
MSYSNKAERVYFLAGVAVFLLVFAFILPQEVGEYSYSNLVNISSNSFSGDVSEAESKKNSGPENVVKLKTQPLYLKTISDLKYEFINQRKDFLEVNLDSMKVRLYRQGNPERIVSILTIGDPQQWGGSAIGLYKIIGGSKSSFSSAAGVYMPYALHYYGKYYIHGEPYYPGGIKYSSDFSGGCIRLKNKDAKEIYQSTNLEMPVLVIAKEKDSPKFVDKKLFSLSGISATGYLVADLESGFVFTQKNYKKQFPIASITKLMTAVVVAENVNLRKSITVKKEMLDAYGSTKGLEVGKKFRVVELFYPLLIESSNDAAEVLAAYLGRSRTIEMMNEKAKAILMEDTEFVDPHGFDRRNISTPQDLFQLARYIWLARPLIWEITKGNQVSSFGNINFDIGNLWNKNIFIYDPTFVGGKTGYTFRTGYNAVFIFKFMTEEKDIRYIVFIVLDSKNLRSDTQKLYNWIWKNYSLLPASK